MKKIERFKLLLLVTFGAFVIAAGWFVTSIFQVSDLLEWSAMEAASIDLIPSVVAIVFVAVISSALCVLAVHLIFQASGGECENYERNNVGGQSASVGENRLSVGRRYNSRVPERQSSHLKCMESGAAQNCTWRQYSGGVESDFRVFCVGSGLSNNRMTRLAMYFSETIFASVDICSCFEVSLESVVAQPDKWNLLLIDFDHVEFELDIEDIVEELIAFRESFPRIPVVLISKGFSSNGSDSTRAAVADCFFRPSASNELISSYLFEIFENNDVWRSRVELFDYHQSDTVIPFRRAAVRSDST